MAEREYRRLTRSKIRSSGSAVSFSWSSLWLGKDHVLMIQATSMREEYKRFYFRDIQSIMIRRTKRRMVWNWILSPLLILSLLLLASAFRTTSLGPEIFSVIFVAMLTVPLVLNNALGPACAVYFRSAVQIQEIPSLCRVGQSRKMIDRLRPWLAAAQGEMSREEMAARIQAMQSGTATVEVPVSND